MTSGSLFRPESEKARSSSWLGRVVLVRPLSFAVLTMASLAFAALLAAFFLIGEYTRKARVTGVIAPAHGIIRIVAPQSGTVQSIRTREGEVVASRRVLFVLSDPRALPSRENVGAAIATRLAMRVKALDEQHRQALESMRLEQEAIADRQRSLARELDQIDVELEIQSRRAALSAESLERARKLERKGFVSPAAVEREEGQELEQLARVEAARRTRLSLARELSRLEHDLAALASRSNAQIAAIDAQRAALEQESLEREAQFSSTIVAPAAGTVAAVLVEPGQSVVAGATLATIVPADGPLEAHLYSPSRAIGFVRAGQEVLLRYLAYPHQKFGSHKGRVIGVSRNPLSPAELGFVPGDGSREPLYRIKAALERQAVIAYGRAEPLQPGLQVEADILLDRRRLIEWIFEPLLSLAGRA